MRFWNWRNARFLESIKVLSLFGVIKEKKELFVRN